MEQLCSWQWNMVEVASRGPETEQKVTRNRSGDILQRPGSDDIFLPAKPYFLKVSHLPKIAAPSRNQVSKYELVVNGFVLSDYS